jgi:uncharacterized NAD(P)/FAD-binding protein YdhS
MSANRLEVCLIGAGPRGLSVLERICANARNGARVPIRLHVVDPYLPGAGRVWRTDQLPHLLMNTVASQITVFSDDTVDMQGVREPGPSLFEWAQFITLIGPFDGCAAGVAAEARELGPDSYPTRALYGHYLRWVFGRLVCTAPPHVAFRPRQARAIRLNDGPHGRQTVQLDDGCQVTGIDAVVLAQGHVPAAPTEQESDLAAFAAANELLYFPPGNPADADLSALRPGQPVAVRGLGLAFFDYLALLTAGRGGSFERSGDRLVYRRSGREPRLYAGSRRGVPYHARGENQKGPHGRHLPQVLTPDRIAELRGGAGVSGLDFRSDVWPLIAKEVETVYYSALLRAGRCACHAERFRETFLASPPGGPAEEQTLRSFGVDPGLRWDWERIARPYGDRRFTDRRNFRQWLLEYLRRDVAQARGGNVDDPVKAAVDVLRDVRNEIRLLVDHGGLTPDSHRDDLDRWYTPLNAFLSIGPPIRRIEEMIALIEAGVLDVLGPDVQVTAHPEAGAFVYRSAQVPGSVVRTRALIEARLPDGDVRRTTDPLLRHLFDTGQARPYVITGAADDRHETGGLAVSLRPYHLLDRQGRPHPRRFAFGVPTESVHWATAAGARPGLNSVTLSDADAIARAVLSLVDKGRAGTGPADAAFLRRRVDGSAVGSRAVARQVIEETGEAVHAEP